MYINSDMVAVRELEKLVNKQINRELEKLVSTQIDNSITNDMYMSGRVIRFMFHTKSHEEIRWYGIVHYLVNPNMVECYYTLDYKNEVFRDVKISLGNMEEIRPAKPEEMHYFFTKITQYKNTKFSDFCKLLHPEVLNEYWNYISKSFELTNKQLEHKD